MATTPTLVSVEEYLRTSYHPDCDYIDGEVLERTVGETPHGRLQTFLAWFFRNHDDEWQIEVITEQRVQVSERNYRIPDVTLASIPNLDELIIRTPPLLCVEILSSKDRMREVQERLDDYAAMGVQAMWVIDPWRELAYVAGGDGVLREEKGMLTVAGTAIQIGVDEIFAELERLRKRSGARG